MIIVIIPYRNRAVNLENSLGILQEYVPMKNVWVLEQAPGLPFNKGVLINLGVKEAAAFGATSVWISDVDMIPVRVNLEESDRCVRLIDKVSLFRGRDLRWGIPYPTYYGGSILVNVREFFKVNGFSNGYWGWGGEDDDFGLRVKRWGLGWEHREGVIYHQAHEDAQGKGSSEAGVSRNSKRWVEMEQGRRGNEEGVNQVEKALTRTELGEFKGFRRVQAWLKEEEKL